ncbi:MAG: sensor histidine kinase [Planctomycetota bacterium]
MTMISQIMDGIVYADTEDRIKLMNPVAEELLGLKSFMAMGRTIAELEAENELTASLLVDRKKARELGKISRTVEVHHNEQDLLYIKVTTSVVLNQHDTFSGTLTVLEDVTSNYKSDQLKNQYLSIVAHELRTPLTGIKTFATMMVKGSLGELNEPQQRVMESIREQSLRLEHQIDKLINLGYIDSDEYAQDLQVVDVRELTSATVAPFEQIAKDRDISLRTHLPDENTHGSIYIQADQTDLKRSLQAIVENAVKFTPDGGSVDFAATISGNEVVFSIQDTGIGIDPRYHGRIFEKFFQVEDPLTRHHGGAGLGLFVAQGVLDAHGSEIEVESELGKGARFTFRLQKYDDKAGSDLDSQEPASSTQVTLEA